MDMFLQAINFATLKHSGQKRKDGKTPYIAHPLAVALILSRVTSDKNILIAAILHDVLEDTDSTFIEISENFGLKVATMVQECSEEHPLDSWDMRKQAVLEKMPAISHSSALIKSADMVHNTYDLLQSLTTEGPDLLKNFHSGLQKKLEYDNKRLALLKTYHPSPLLKNLEDNLKKIELLRFD